jgi:hypothetical protein
MMGDHVPALRGAASVGQTVYRRFRDRTPTGRLCRPTASELKHIRARNPRQALFSRARLTSDVVLCPCRISTRTISPP